MREQKKVSLWIVFWAETGSKKYKMRPWFRFEVLTNTSVSLVLHARMNIIIYLSSSQYRLQRTNPTSIWPWNMHIHLDTIQRTKQPLPKQPFFYLSSSPLQSAFPIAHTHTRTHTHTHTHTYIHTYTHTHIHTYTHTHIHTYTLTCRPSHYIHALFNSSFAYKTASRFEWYFESK